MLRLPAILFFLFSLPIFGITQRQIKGIVINAATREPIAGSSVFVSNTSRGTVSDKEGRFELNDIPAGKQDLVISSIGFETNVYSFSSTQLPLRVQIELQLKVQELANVDVEPSLEEGWDKWGTTFTQYFIGITPNAYECRIRNTEAIHFRFYKKSNRLIAYSDERIIVENKALGYRVIYQLEEFEILYGQGRSSFAGYPLFEDMDEGKKKIRSKWRVNRNKAYYGSMMHFMRSIFDNSTSSEGFEVRRMQRIPNLEKERVRAVYKSNVTRSTANDGTISIKRNAILPDSEAYYQRILNEKDFTDVYGQTLLTPDSLVIEQDPASKAVFFNDYLHVTYKKEFEEKAYVLFLHERRGPTFQQSLLWLQNQQPFVIDANGSYFPPQEVYSLGYWGWDEKMANILPLDFQPYDL